VKIKSKGARKRMTKQIKMLVVLVGLLALGVSSAYAVPTIDGSLAANEWDNTGYQYYLDVTDVNEAAITNTYDIKHAVLFQEYNGLALPDADDGIYLLIETYATPPSLTDAGAGSPPASISMNADFNGDGFVDLVITHQIELGAEVLKWHRPAGSILGAETLPVNFGVEGTNFKRGTVLEYFIPSTTGGSPHAPFPLSFIGTVVYDNGGDEPDDRITGSLVAVPEPGTFFLLGAGLLSMLGFGKKFGRNEN
jgi:hypothetical protein